MTASDGGPPEFVLASASPRRADILRTLGIPFRVEVADIDETPRPGELPAALVERLAREKARAVAGRLRSAGSGGSAPILAGDTVVALGSRVLGKPADTEEAVRMLEELSGSTHRVLSALALLDRAPPEGQGQEEEGGTIRSGVQVTRVTFRRFQPAEARAYAATGEPLDKAGAYGIQGMGATLVESIEGDYSGVVGLPVPLLVRLMEERGTPYRCPAPRGRARREPRGGPARSVAPQPPGAALRRPGGLA